MDPVSRFATEVESVVRRYPDQAETLARLEEPFASLLTPSLLPSTLCDADRNVVRRVLIHRSDLVTVFAIASPPGFMSTVHDHQAWGLVGQLSGEELETVYRPGGRTAPELVHLERISTRRLVPGDVVKILPPDHDIHQVVNVTGRPSVTVHAFSRDLVHEGFVEFLPELFAPVQFEGGLYENEEGTK